MTNTAKFFRNRETIFCTLIFLAAFIVRIGYVLSLKQHYFFFDQPSSDVKYYQQWAQDIASGNWIGDGPFYGMPLYAYVLAFIKRLTLNSDTAIRLVHLLIGSCNCLLVYQLTKRIFPPAAYLAAILTATNFTLIYYDWLMMPVSLIALLSMTVLLFLMDRDKLKKTSEWVILGVLMGLTALGDGKTVIFFGLTCVALSLSRSLSLWENIRKYVLPFTLGFMLIVGGCALRNKLISGDWILISAQSGLSFFVGNNAKSDGLYYNPEFIRPTHDGQDEDQQIFAQEATQRSLSPGMISDFWRNQALKFIYHEPAAYARLLAKKAILFFREVDSPDEIDLALQKEWKSRLDVNSFYLLCPLSILGAFFAWRQRITGTGFINLMIISQLIFTLLFFLTTRHRATVLPFFILYEAYFLIMLWQWVRAKAFKSVVGSAIFAALYWVTLKPLELPKGMIEFIHHANAGVAYAKKERHKLAQAHYLKALELQPFDSNTLFNLGNSYFYEKDLANAQKYYEKVLTLVPTHVDARFNLGYTLEEKGELDQALMIFLSLMRDQPDRLDIQYRLAYINAKRKNCETAAQFASSVASHAPPLADEMKQLTAQCR